jgi:alpha-mannosidase
VLQVQNHAGALPPVHSFVRIDGDNVVLTAMKSAEDEDALVLRFYEWAGKESDVSIHLPDGAESARETNLIERPAEELPVRGGVVSVHTKPYEIKTVLVKFAASH